MILAWVITRAWILLSGFQIIGYPDGGSLFADVRLYDWWAGNMQDGHFPINDDMWQYPPLAALIFLIGYLIAPQTIGFVFLALAIDALILYFLYEAGMSQAKKTYIPSFVWISSGLLMGPVMLGRFDVFPTFFAVLALIFVSQPRAFGIHVAMGAILKVWPGLLLLAIPKNKFKSSLIWFLVTFGSLSLLLTLWWPDSFSFLNGQKSRGLQIESIGALYYMIINSFGSAQVIEFRYGALEVLAPGVNQVSLGITVIGLLLLGQIFVWRIRGFIEEVPPSQIALYVVMISMVTSRVLSPQYMVWIFGLLAVVALNPPKNFKVTYLLIAISAFSGQLIYPFLYFDYMDGVIGALLVQIIRLTALLTATFFVWKEIRSQLLVRY